jgi:hypothetical protein
MTRLIVILLNFVKVSKVDRKYWLGGPRLDCSGPGQGQLMGCCEHGIELSGPIKFEYFLDDLKRNCQLLKKGFATCRSLFCGNCS